MTSGERLALIKKICETKDEGRFLALTDEDIEDELSLIQSIMRPEMTDEYDTHIEALAMEGKD